MTNKTITLTSDQYDKVIEVLHEEINCVGFLLAYEDNRVVGSERKELKEDYKLLGDISTTIYEQCE